MAAARRRSAPIYMFNRYADMNQLTGEPGEGWTEVVCHSNKAYGCRDNIQEAVKGLKLYVRLGEDPLVTSSLAIGMTDDALRRFDEELELGFRPMDPDFEQPETTGWAKILMDAEEDLMIILLYLKRQFYGKLLYHLVYDHRHASLSLIECVQADSVSKPVPKRTSDGDYELFLMATESRECGFPSAMDINLVHLLCVFSPGTGVNPASAWEIRRRVRWSVPVSVEKRFRTDLTFSFQGKGFWVDLSQGMVYCDLDTSAGDSIVDFSYIGLPPECVVDLEKILECEQPMQATRTMGCDRDSIWFVCIDESILDDCAHHLVSMWTLKLHGGEGQWKNEAKFSFRDLWRFNGFKKARLPEAPVGYPRLNAADGVLYLVLSGEYLGCDAEICWVDHMCSFDIRNQKLLWHGIVHDLPPIQPAAFPSCFFQTECDHHPAAAGLTFLLQPGSKGVFRKVRSIGLSRELKGALYFHAQTSPELIWIGSGFL